MHIQNNSNWSLILLKCPQCILYVSITNFWTRTHSLLLSATDCETSRWHSSITAILSGQLTTRVQKTDVSDFCQTEMAYLPMINLTNLDSRENSNDERRWNSLVQKLSVVILDTDCLQRKRSRVISVPSWKMIKSMYISGYKHVCLLCLFFCVFLMTQQTWNLNSHSEAINSESPTKWCHKLVNLQRKKRKFT